MSMFKDRLAIAVALMVMVMAGQPGWAQQAAPQAVPVAAPSTAGRFNGLAAADQKIARALFLAQRVTAAGPAPLSLDQVAALKGRAGWGKVLKEMHSRGLIEARSLDEAMSDEARFHHGGAKAKIVTVTRGSGSNSTIGSLAVSDSGTHSHPPVRSQ